MAYFMRAVSRTVTNAALRVPAAPSVRKDVACSRVPSAFSVPAVWRANSTSTPPPPRPDGSEKKQGPPPTQPFIEPERTRATIGPFNMLAGILFVGTGIGLYFYFRHEKEKLVEQRSKSMETQQVGRPRVGGPFRLVSSTGYPFTDEDLLGSFSLIYFGFTNCPDICPEELDKMSNVVERIAHKHGNVINPVFVTCDPARDKVPMVDEYIADFHPRMIGLTGSYDDIKAACKAYRVYFSTPPGADPSSDYLVDHSIFFYLMDPEGKFVDAFGKASTPDEVYDKVDDYVNRWKATGMQIREANAKERTATDGRPKSSDAELFAPPSTVPSVPPAVLPAASENKGRLV